MIHLCKVALDIEQNPGYLTLLSEFYPLLAALVDFPNKNPTSSETKQSSLIKTIRLNFSSSSDFFPFFTWSAMPSRSADTSLRMFHSFFPRALFSFLHKCFLGSHCVFANFAFFQTWGFMAVRSNNLYALFHTRDEIF